MVPYFDNGGVCGFEVDGEHFGALLAIAVKCLSQFPTPIHQVGCIPTVKHLSAIISIKATFPKKYANSFAAIFDRIKNY